MHRRLTLISDERGMALVLSLMILLIMTALLLALLGISGIEPQISRNLSDTMRARYLAEAGIEAGYNLLVATADANATWSALLVSATTSNPWVAVPGLSDATIVGAPSGGAFTVTVRNDFQAGDTAITGAAPDASPSSDSNRAVIMRSTGTFSGATKTIEVVVKRIALPPLPGAVNIAGNQSDTFINTQTFDIDGRDYACASNCDTASSWTVSTNPMKYGVMVQPGIQTNLGISYEQNVESAVGTGGGCNAKCANAKQASIQGRNQSCMSNCTDPSTVTTGLPTIAPDASLSPTVMSRFLGAVAAAPGTTILQSTAACPLVLTGSGTPTSTPTLTNGCGLNKTIDLGARTAPKLVYIRGDLDPGGGFTGLRLDSGIKGAGVLIIEDADLQNYGTLAWDGLVIVSGQYVSSSFMSGSSTTIRGALASIETRADEAAGSYDFYIDKKVSTYSIQNSKQNIDMTQVMRALTSLSGWREL